MGRPLDGDEVKQVYSVRLEPSIQEALCKKYGSLQRFLDKVIRLSGYLGPTVKEKNEIKKEKK